MTEDEAKTKWCHLTMPTDKYDRCEGSRCLAWRWVQTILYKNEIELERKAYGFYLAEIKTENTDHGYCGLAGKP